MLIQHVTNYQAFSAACTKGFLSQGQPFLSQIWSSCLQSPFWLMIFLGDPSLHPLPDLPFARASLCTLCLLFVFASFHFLRAMVPGLKNFRVRLAEGRTRLSDFSFTFHFPALEKEMSTHSSVLAWRIPGTGEPDGLPSMGSHRVRHD